MVIIDPRVAAEKRNPEFSWVRKGGRQQKEERATRKLLRRGKQKGVQQKKSNVWKLETWLVLT